jgi:hypothetical protein
VVKKWKEAIEQQKSKRKRDDGDEVKKEDGGKKVKTEGKPPYCLKSTCSDRSLISCTFSLTCNTSGFQGGCQAKEGR